MSHLAPPSPPPGALWPRVLERADHALAAGAIEPIATESTVLEDGGIPFLVRVVSSLQRKARAREKRGPDHNPFLPYDPDLFVADLSPTHLCLLNRYNVMAHHLLVITRELEAQEELINLRDFQALWRLMAEVDGLGFYNSGPDAGASQRHKHLQLVPLPLGDGPEQTPMDRVLAGARYDGGEQDGGSGAGAGSAPRVGRAALPFRHALGRLEPDLHRYPERAAEASLVLYRTLLQAVGPEETPYNLLLTREWILLVPRSQGRHDGIEVNALGYAGSLLLRHREQLEPLRRRGPLELLRAVGVQEHPPIPG